MTDTVIVALISGISVLIGTIVSSIFSSNATKKVMQFEIQEIKKDISRLEVKQDKHNNVIERMAVAESSLKSAHHRIDEIQKGGK